MSTRMTQSEFRLLCDFIQQHFGLRFPPENAYLLERRMQPRLAALGFSSFLDYHDFLRNPALPEAERELELDELFDRIATRETYFFRESYQLDVFRRELLPALHKARPRGRTLAVWSAGCASGEELYSLAMEVLGAQSSGVLSGWQVELVGSDYSLQALAAARRGVYGPSAFRQADPEQLGRYFHKVSGGWEISSEVRRLCRLVRINLMSQDLGPVGGPFDAIFCRNVLIYFDRGAREPFINRLAARLVPGGYLFLGHSESLSELVTPLRLVRLGGELVYHKPVP
jgi:chemotaxis protein methyltransferase CheR